MRNLPKDEAMSLSFENETAWSEIASCPDFSIDSISALESVPLYKGVSSTDPKTLQASWTKIPESEIVRYAPF